MRSKFDDAIIYTAVANEIVVRADFDKQNLETNLSLDEFYSSKRTYSKAEIKPEVVKPSKIIADIKKKLTSVELAVLKEFSKL